MEEVVGSSSSSGGTTKNILDRFSLTKDQHPRTAASHIRGQTLHNDGKTSRHVEVAAFGGSRANGEFALKSAVLSCDYSQGEGDILLSDLDQKEKTQNKIKICKRTYLIGIGVKSLTSPQRPIRLQLTVNRRILFTYSLALPINEE
uniref:Uncharacterized protein n=1 Tax=Vespula pensylvanica TaxID=30213 RepID=A0A834KDE1_VESPE|nr:hypothetical protein H0235_015187 [Vespula pensylvanica]